MAPNFGRIFRKTATGREGEWFFCLRHEQVEEGPDCPAKDRLGPYPTRADAEHAMDLARERNENWRNDARWNDPDPDGDRPDHGGHHPGDGGFGGGFDGGGAHGDG
ncbi:hypothetical protein [Streptomyces avicenniae]|uniref:hypothetical protein n=1 Tax=Streptomyces avicenniae TaxID=500153 RepID=UPI000B1CBC63|nr:hypothetical protein [Streptomyces avicenniae]